MENVLKACALKALALWQTTQRASWRILLTPARLRRQRAFVAAKEREPITLFLAPEAGLEPFYASHVILARVLQDAGHPVLVLSCNGLQPTCSLKLAMHIDPTAPGESENAACVRCRSSLLRVGASYGLPDIAIEELLDKDKRAEIERVLATYAAAPWEAVYDGIPIGSGCLGETLRAQRKIAIEEMEEEDVALVRALLFSALAVYLAVKEIGTRFKIGRIAYFGDYAYFLAPQVYAQRGGIPLTNVCHAYHRDTDRRYLNLWPAHAAAHQLEQVRRWPAYQHKPLDSKTIVDIADGALYRLYGHGGVSTYSPNWSADPGDLRATLGLAPGGKLLVAYSNSTDEVICHQHTLRTLGQEFGNAPNPFRSQIEWLRALLDWVGPRRDLRLVIRLHPRMAVSKRHLNVSTEYEHMKALFADLPANVAVVWPESPVSSYNLAELADVALTAWSSIGLELARFGVPVIAAFQQIGPFPKSRFIDFAETSHEYFELIERALERSPAIDSIVGAFRWTNFLHWTPLIDIADVVPEPDYAQVPTFRTPHNAPTIIDVMAGGADIIALNMARLPQGATALASERRAVVAALERFLFFFMTGRLEAPAGLRIGKQDHPGQVRISASDSQVTMVDADRRTERRSPLAARLVRVLGEASAAAAMDEVQPV